MLDEGIAAKDVAEFFGVNVRTIYGLRQRFNFTSPTSTAQKKSVSFRLSEEEYRVFTALASECGCASNAEFARVLVRSASGFLEVSRDKGDELNEIRAELHKIGVNINQIARAANSGRIELVQMQWEDVRELKKHIIPLRTYLNGVVDEVRRKGARLWRKSEFGK